MATSKKGSSTKSNRRAELVPLDDPAVQALVERAVAAVGDDAFAGALNAWLSARERELARAYFWLQRWLDETIGSERAIPFVIEAISMVDEARGLQAFAVVTASFVGDHRNWLAAARFDSEAYVRGDSARAVRRRAVIASMDAVVALTKDRSERIRAGAAFLLAWLGESVRERAVAALSPLLQDKEPAVRASAVVSLAMHGDFTGVSALMDDPDERARLCAAIAESLDASSERGRALLESALSGSDVQWPELAFNNGALARWAITRYGAACQREPERSAERFVEALRDPARAAFVDAIILGATAGTAVGDTSSAALRSVLAVIVERSELHNAAIEPLRRAGLIGANEFVTNDVLIDGVRARFGIPRPPPTYGSKARATARGRSDYAQHFWADFATAPDPDNAKEIADAIATAIPVDELVDVLMRLAQDIDGTTLPASRVAGLAFEVALPEGVERRGDRFVHRPEDWHVAHANWCRDREREGWLSLSSWWTGEEVVTRWFDLRGRSLEAVFGHDWNAGNPVLTEARYVPTARYRLTPLVARAARARHGEAFDRALQAFIEKAPGNSWNGMRAMSIAIELFAGTQEAPPVFFDQQAALAQRTWSYVTALLAPYAKLLSVERREELAVVCASQSDYALPILYEIAPTPRVLEALTPSLRNAVANWPDFVGRERHRWVRALGEELAAQLAEACGPAPVIETKKRRSRRG